MTKVIWKYRLGLERQQSVTVPKGGETRLVDIDPETGMVCLWIEVDPEAATEDRSFSVIGTGWVVPAGGKHVGSVVGGRFVWHVFEVVS